MKTAKDANGNALAIGDRVIVTASRQRNGYTGTLTGFSRPGARWQADILSDNPREPVRSMRIHPSRITKR